MKNLRIVPKQSFQDTFHTGDHQSVIRFAIVRDWTLEELSKHNYSQEVIVKGVEIEVFNNEENAKKFLAVPDMLEALINLRRWAISKGIDTDGKLILHTDNAINKATK